MLKIGLIVNPYAGIGGRVGLKGSDGEQVRNTALAMGGEKLAEAKTEICLTQIDNKKQISVFTVSGEMGENLCKKMGFSYQLIHQAANPSTEQDTLEAVTKLIALELDIILFAGGDGTARDVFTACEAANAEEQQVVLGIPAGVKIHSGVFAITPKAAGELIENMRQGSLLSLISADVMDIDEFAFRNGRVKAKRYGYLNVPGALEYVQAVKTSGVEDEALVLDDIAAEIIEAMDDETYYVIGSGTTCAAIMQNLNLENTLLGSDIVYQHCLFKADAIERDFLELLKQGKRLKFVITVIGGQGHLLGRGNHQISPQVIRLVGWNNFEIIATKSKLKQLEGRPLLTDCGDPELDSELKGTKKVTTGYRDFVIYPIGYSQSNF